MKLTKVAQQCLITAISILLAVSPAHAISITSQWETWQPGLEVGEFTLTTPGADVMDLATQYDFTIVRVSPKHFSLDLLMASQTGKAYSAENWAKQTGMTCVINAGLYQADHLTHTSYMRLGNHFNHKRLTKDKMLLEAQPNVSHWMLPAFRLRDKECDHFATGPVDANYRMQVQNIRALSCKGKNVWKQSHKKWSMTLFGTDVNGRALLIFGKKPRSVHDAIEQLKQLPIQLKRAMYLEGAHVAALYCQSPKRVLKRIGNFRGPSGIFRTNEGQWELPNMIGIKEK